MHSYFTRTIVSLLIGLAALPCFARASRPDFTKATDELIRLIEAHDPYTRSAPEEWQTIQKHLRGAAAIAETEQGFAKSLLEVLRGWNGQGLHLLTDTSVAYYAYQSETAPFWEVGLVFAQRGARWYVKQLSKQAPRSVHRGDAVMQKDFHPIKSFGSGKPISLRLQSQALAEASETRLSPRQISVKQWALQATQEASTLIPWRNKKLCFEKTWLWLDSEVEAVLRSKIDFAAKNCAALIVDLRDTSGPGGKGLSTLPAATKVPMAVLVNQETREAAVAMAIDLKNHYQAEIFGEPTASRQLPSQVIPLKELSALLVFYPQNSGSLIPDQLIDDAWMFAEGFDGTREKALVYLQAKLSAQ